MHNGMFLKIAKISNSKQKKATLVNNVILYLLQVIVPVYLKWLSPMTDITLSTTVSLTNLDKVWGFTIANEFYVT